MSAENSLFAGVRTAIADQIAAYLDGGDYEWNVDAYGISTVIPGISLQMATPPNFFGTFGPGGVCRVRFRLIMSAPKDESGVIMLDDALSVGTGNGNSVIDALESDQSFGGAISGFEYAPDEYDAENVTASYLLDLIVMKQGAEVG